MAKWGWLVKSPMFLAQIDAKKLPLPNLSPHEGQHLWGGELNLPRRSCHDSFQQHSSGINNQIRTVGP